uniref:C2H2-type domain-containing protein n=1 Tax=Meloidogyne enterolobii TaxID=390850 RepID=A0A6V7WHV2_MELEN|nr:unnamed protein product [Meloidogyne enterolobii]
MFNKRFKLIVILFFLLKNYSEGGPKERKTKGKGKSDATADHQESPINYHEQQSQGSASFPEGGSSAAPSFTLTIPKNFCEWNRCEEAFDNEAEFVQHVEEHADSLQELICRWTGCERNEKPFNSQRHFFEHLPAHTGEKRYACDFVAKNGVRCTNRYASQSNLKRHQHFHKFQTPSGRSNGKYHIGNPLVVEAQSPDDGPQHFGDQAYPPPHGFYQPLGYPAYTLHEWQHFTQLPTNIGHQEQHIGHTTHTTYGDNTGSSNAEGGDEDLDLELKL